MACVLLFVHAWSSFFSCAMMTLIFLTVFALFNGAIGRTITPISNSNIHFAVRGWLDDPVSAEVQFGHISDWEVYRVRDMTGLFRYAEDFNEDISGTFWSPSPQCHVDSNVNTNSHILAWNVTSVTSMREIFYRAKNFNSEISNWKTQSVTDMSYAFG